MKTQLKKIQLFLVRTYELTLKLIYLHKHKLKNKQIQMGPQTYSLSFFFLSILRVVLLEKD
jgi:hypothetical protein